MSAFDEPFDADRHLRLGCACGRHASAAEHDAALATVAAGEDAALDRAVQSTVMRALFPQDALRRRLLKSVGASTAMAAMASVFPLGAATALAAEGGAPEKPGSTTRCTTSCCATTWRRTGWTRTATCSCA